MGYQTIKKVWKVWKTLLKEKMMVYIILLIVTWILKLKLSIMKLKHSEKVLLMNYAVMHVESIHYGYSCCH